MLRFLFYMGIALTCFVAGVIALAAGVVLSTPNPADIKGCVTATMHNVELCPGSKNYVPLSRISPYVRHAVIVSEDSSFYQHNGLDLHELQQSFDENLKEGRIVRGGSTITQQLAKNVYLSGEKSIFRKMREALIAVQLEKILTKDEILERYLNVVEFGPGVYGIKDAAQFYFSKHPHELTVLEGAWLAFVLPNPKKYSQSYRRRELTRFARTQLSTIVKRMGSFRRIPQEEADAALNQLEYMFKPYVDPLEALSPEEQAILEGMEAAEGVETDPSAPPAEAEIAIEPPPGEESARVDDFPLPTPEPQDTPEPVEEPAEEL